MMASTRQRACSFKIELRGMLSWLSLWNCVAVKLGSSRVGSSQDARRVLVGMGLMMLLFVALYCNQAQRDLSFGWLSRTVASPVSAAFNASSAAKDKADLVDVVPSPALSFDHSGLLGDPLSPAPVEQASELNETLGETMPTKNSSASSYFTNNLASNATGSTIESNKQSEQVLETSNISDANDEQMMVSAPSMKDYATIDSKNTTSLMNESQKSVAEIADDQGAVLSTDSFTPKTLDSPTVAIATREQAPGPGIEDKVVHFPGLTPSTKPSNDSGNDLHPSPEVEISSWRFNLELGLKDAKRAIAMAPPVLVDADLYPPLYHNVSSFKMSYEIMERVFKVYVYEEGEKPMVRAGPLTGIYSSEGQFIERMVHGNQFTVKDHTTAHIFFLPYSVSNMVDKLYVPDSHTMQPINDYIRDYVNMLAAKYPFWNETQGADHFFVSCHDWGLATTVNHKELDKNAMKVVCNADISDWFVLEKDASLPEIYLQSRKLPQRLGGPGPKKRPILAFFAGQMHGRVRPVLLEHWKDKEPDMKIYEVIPSGVAKKMSYVQHMKSSKYCICAMGYEVNSPRIVEAIYYDCVPVIIADNFVLPFSNVLNWDAFSLTVAEIDIPNLRKILLDISDKKYRAMQKRLKLVRRHFMWHEQVVRYDVFHMILHSVWMRRLRQVS